MAKKKGKKAQKQPDWPSPPDTPKPPVEASPQPIEEPAASLDAPAPLPTVRLPEQARENPSTTEQDVSKEIVEHLRVEPAPEEPGTVEQTTESNIADSVEASTQKVEAKVESLLEPATEQEPDTSEKPTEESPPEPTPREAVETQRVVDSTEPGESNQITPELSGTATEEPGAPEPVVPATPPIEEPTEAEPQPGPPENKSSIITDQQPETVTESGPEVLNSTSTVTAEHPSIPPSTTGLKSTSEDSAAPKADPLQQTELSCSESSIAEPPASEIPASSESPASEAQVSEPKTFEPQISEPKACEPQVPPPQEEKPKVSEAAATEGEVFQDRAVKARTPEITAVEARVPEPQAPVTQEVSSQVLESKAVEPTVIKLNAPAPAPAIIAPPEPPLAPSPAVTERLAEEPRTNGSHPGAPEESASSSAPSVATTSWETAHSEASKPESTATTKGTAQRNSPPKPSATALHQVIVEDRPPAPTPPPLNRPRPRHAPAFDDDDDDEEDHSALIQPRLRGDPLSRDTSRGLTYPPQPPHNRSVFASRVPSEHYSNPPQRPPPPGYHPGYYPPTAPPYYHAHNMSQPGGYSPYGPPSHSSSPYQEPWGQYPPTYPPYGSPPRHDSVGSRDFSLSPPNIDNGSAIEDDTGDIFSRISQAIPDLHVLLARYKETHGQLSVREELLRRAGIEQQERLRAKDDEISHLKEKVSTIENKQSSEANRLRLEIGNMEEQVKELRETAAETGKYKKEAEETRLALEAAKASWEAKYKELEASKDALEKAFAERIAKTELEFEEWKKTATTKHDAEKIALAIQFDKKLKEADVIAETQRQEAAAAFVREKDDLRSEHQRQQREREENFEKVREELETKLSAAQKDREEALRHERESRELWDIDRKNLTKAHQEDRESLQRGWEEQRQLLEAQYRQKKEESDKAWIELHAEANRKAEEQKAKAEKLTRDLEELQKKFDVLKAESEKEKEIIKSVAGNLESEKARLEKLMECYGDIAEIKSKGDTYYLVSFSQLQKQIMDLATTHFVHLPITPPSDVLEKIPPELPSFLGNTSASRQLRTAYVAHIVSAMVTFRVFGPFLFSLGRRYDKADSLFLAMSNHIREKSTRKEAIWRQQTLLAAFTSSGAKQRINTAAGTVVDEIVAEIKHFADPKEEEGIRIAVRRIVKLAAETWRFARLERELITATMPAVHDDKHEFTGPDFWPPYKSEDTPIASLAGTAIPDEAPKLLLRLFPVIHREPKHESSQSSSEVKLEDFIYHHGLALYDDARCVEIRREELRAAGMPPTTTSSPTAADFPPPIIPPPRDPPPPTPEVGAPEVGEELAVKSEKDSTPPSPRDPPPPTPEVGAPEVGEELTVKSEKDSTPPSPKDHLPPTSDAGSSGASDRATIRSGKTCTPPPAPIDPIEFLCRSASPSVKSTKSSPDSYVRPLPGPISYSIPGDTADQSAPTATPVEGQEKSPEASPPPPSEASRKSPAPSLKSSKSSAARSVKDVESVDASPPADEPAAPSSLEANATPQTAENSADEACESLVPPLKPPSESSRRSRSPSVKSSKSSAAHYVRPIPVPIGDSNPADAPPPAGSIVSATPSKAPTASHPPSPRESAVIPPFHAPSAASTKSSSHTLPTPPRSRAPSPLFPAEDEIEALRPHRSRNPSAITSSRRSGSAPKSSNEELKKETTKRTSGYALSNSKSTSASVDDRSHRPCSCDRSMSEQSMRSSNSRYMCESRSAAIKGLYPNSPLAGTVCSSHPSLAGSHSSMPRAHSLRRRSERLSERGSLETGIGVQGSMEGASERRNSES